MHHTVDVHMDESFFVLLLVLTNRPLENYSNFGSLPRDIKRIV